MVPCDRPLRRQLFVEAENLLDGQVHIAGFAPQSLQIAERIVETVDVIDPEAGELAFARELDDQRVGMAKNFFIFDAQRNQLVDVEKSPIIELFRGDFPKRQPIPLLRQQPIEQVETFRLAGGAVESADIVVQMTL